MRYVCVFCGSSPGRDPYYDGLIGFLDHAVVEGFVSRENRGLVLIADTPEALLDRLASE